MTLFLNVTLATECRPNYSTILLWGPFYEFASYTSLSLRQPSDAAFPHSDQNATFPHEDWNEYAYPPMPSQQVDINDFLVAYFGILLMLVMAVYSSITTSRDSPRLGVPLNVPSSKRKKEYEQKSREYTVEKKYTCFEKQSLIRDEKK